MRWPTPAQEIAIAAVVADRFKVKPWEYARYTDWYICRVLLHPRDSFGAISMPADPISEKLPQTLSEELAVLEMAAAQFGDNIVGVEEAKAKLREKYERKKV